MEIEREEMVRLHESRMVLLQRAILLRDRLKRREESERPLPISAVSQLPRIDDDDEMSDSSAGFTSKLCAISRRLNGVMFASVDRRWLRDNVYAYTSRVVARTISFDVRLIVALEDVGDFRIDEIHCSLVDVDRFRVMEMSPWLRTIASYGNFSLLMAALSEYNEKNIVRSKILHRLELNGYANVEPCAEETGGILVRVHSSVDVKSCYLVFQWTIQFLEFTLRVEHFFTVTPTRIGAEFSRRNSSLLKEFCEIGLTKTALMDLWDRLCIAIDARCPDGGTVRDN